MQIHVSTRRKQMTLLKVVFKSSQHFMVKQWMEMLDNNLYHKAASITKLSFYNDFVLENSTISRARPRKSVSSCLDSQGQCSYVNTPAEIGSCIAFSYSEN